MPAAYPVIGQTQPYAAFLQTGYEHFVSDCGIDGLARVIHYRKLELLSVNALNPGTGQFRAFIDSCKKHYDCICVWEVWNDQLALILKRYGFHKARQREPNGEIVAGWKWTDYKRKGE